MYIYGLPIYHYITLIAFCLQLLNCINNRKWDYLLIYLGFVIMFDIVLANVVSRSSGNNGWVYNVFASLQPPLILWFYRDKFQNKMLLFILGSLIYIILSISYAVVFDFTKIHLKMYSISLVFISVLIGYDTILLIEKDFSFKSLLINPKFYLNVGFILFCVICFPLLLLIERIRYSALGEIFFLVLYVGNFILSFLYLITTICLLKINFSLPKSLTQRL